MPTTFDPIVFDASLILDSMTYELVRVRTTGDFYAEEYRPCWYRSKDALWFKNLEYVSVLVSANSGVLDLTTWLAGDPTVPDSPFWIVDLSGRAARLDCLSPAVSGTRLLIGVQGNYQVWYKSQARLDSLRAGNVFARFDEQLIPLTETPLSNPWTSALSMVSPIVRGLRFDNLDLRKNLQAWSMAWESGFRIGALLGLVDIYSWDSTTAMPVTGSLFEVHQSLPFDYRTEKPFLTDGGIRTTRYLRGAPEVWWSNKLLDPSTYTCTSTGVILQSGYLTPAQQQNLMIKYQTLTYESTGGAMVSESLDHRNHVVLATSGINIDTGTLRINWIWDRSPENTEGTGVFT